MEMESEPLYPSDWFKQNPGAKPKICLPKFNNDAEFKEIVANGIKEKKLTLDQAMVYLYFFMNDFPMELDKDWSSYGVTIGKKNSKITPWDILDVEITNAPFTLRTPAGIYGSNDDIATAIYILAAYRLGGINHPKYREKIVNNIKKKMYLDDAGISKYSFDAIKNSYGQWYKDKTFCKMVAAIDMYLGMLPHQLRILKISTITSRLKGMDALLSVHKAQETFNTNYKDMFDWLWTPSLKEDFSRLFRSGEEFGFYHSYFAYHIDFGMSLRSQYSSSANPNIYFWANIINSLSGRPRGINAKNSMPNEIKQIVFNAKVAFYAHEAVNEFNSFVNLRALKAFKMMAKLSKLKTRENGEPDNCKSDMWKEYLAQHDNNYTPKMLEVFTKKASYIQTTRTNTIGYMVKNNPTA